MRESDVLIIGAGPAGAVAASLLVSRGLSVTVIERSVFPRFAIGEGLLPQCTELLAEAGMLDAVRSAGFQSKKGAVIESQGETTALPFHELGLPSTWHVERARFDQVLAEDARHRGAHVCFAEQVTSIDVGRGGTTLSTESVDDGIRKDYQSRFLLDASGAGRVLPRRLGLTRAADAPPRAAIFAHANDGIDAADFNRHKTWLSIHPTRDDIWYWLIPFAERASVGVVGPLDILPEGADKPACFHAWRGDNPWLAGLLRGARWEAPVRGMRAYAGSVSRLQGPGYALLGNAGEAVDPMFSSGVTLAIKSAVLAARLVARELDGKRVDWEADFETPMRRGAGVFHAFVESWYQGELQKILFSERRPDNVYQKLLSILAGYVWDPDNPYTTQTARRMTTLARVCGRAP
jgi:flavin-dependent dehydrogenase